MTDDPAADSARAAAVILAPSHGAALPTQVEAALAARHSVQRPGSFLDPVSLASLIVAIATLAWTVYNDQQPHYGPAAGDHRPSGSHYPPRTRSHPAP